MKALYSKPEIMQKMANLIEASQGNELYKFLLTQEEYDKYVGELKKHPILECNNVLFFGREVAIEVEV